MFFKLHSEQKIGYKIISKPELGIGEKSNQTHIGLSDRVLTFLPRTEKNIERKNQILIYGDCVEYVDAYYSYIKNPDGSFRSPYIKTGGVGTFSITSAIRDIVKRDGEDYKWFLFWFGLSSKIVVFLLFNEHSNDYKTILNLGIDLSDGEGSKLVSENMINVLSEYIEKRIYHNSISTMKKLEVDTQLGIIQKHKRFCSYTMSKKRFEKIINFEETSKLFAKIGREGEEKINLYFDNERSNKKIKDYYWCNKAGESGNPFDFELHQNDGQTVYLDVKTTKYDFIQDMIFSFQEINFITTEPKNYSIYRVYSKNKDDDEYYLRICNDCITWANNVNTCTDEYSENLEKIHTKLRSAKMSISPNNRLFEFSNEIQLT